MSRMTLIPSALLGLITLLAASPPPSQSEAPVLAGGALLEHMEGMKEHLKGIAMGLQANDSPATLEHVAELQRIVLLAKLETPPNLDEQPESQRAEHRKQFRTDLARLLQELAGMEIDVLADDHEAAFARVAGALLSMRKDAHAKYQLGK